ncbi:MAG TPA: hypothetical protein EYO01_04605 [Phycisphaerales bacterium]|nr:hypothetical protein [Phycisphaerales bacterium]HIN84519.1 hypothetical protein [Phycisphaerales bacterium]HIO52461.1 hypothetical protein [Phycisphaerales bacterium]
MIQKFQFAFALIITVPTYAEFVVGSVPLDAPTGISTVFAKHVDVYGLHVFAKSNVSNSKVLHCANILAQWIDNNEDGVVDDLISHQTLVGRYASMLIWANPNQADGDYDSIPNSTWDNNGFQELFADEMNLGYPANGQFDWTLEEVLHLVTHEGYALAYPLVWGETSSQMTNTMDAVIAGGWYHYNDPTCDYACKATEYMYWSLTSLLGAQNYPWRIPDIADEWELPTPKLMHQHAGSMVQMLQDPQWHIATVLPDGTYNPVAPCIADLDGSNDVNVNDLLQLINAWGQSNVSADIDGSGTVDVGDILLLVDAWGICP